MSSNHAFPPLTNAECPCRTPRLRPRTEEAPLGLIDSEIVDAGFAARHQPRLEPLGTGRGALERRRALPAVIGCACPRGPPHFSVIPRWFETQPVIEALVLAAADVLFDPPLLLSQHVLGLLVPVPVGRPTRRAYGV